MVQVLLVYSARLTYFIAGKFKYIKAGISSSAWLALSKTRLITFKINIKGKLFWAISKKIFGKLSVTKLKKIYFVCN